MDGSDEIELTASGMRLLISPAEGGRAVSWQVDGHELLARHGSDPVEYGMYPMAPWAGRVRGNMVRTPNGESLLPVNYGTWAIHGTVFTSPARVIDVATDPHRSSVTAESVLGAPWPWPGVVRMEWILEPERLTTVIEVQATDEPFPCVVGWHPWFRREIDGARAVWSMNATSMLRRSDDALPVSLGGVPAAGPFDDAFVVPSRRAVISWPSVLEMSIEGDSEWFVLFDALPDALCIEPQSGPPDGLVDHPWARARIVAPDRPLVQQVTWTVSGRRADRG